MPGTSSTSPVSAPDIYHYRTIGFMSSVFANDAGDWGSILGRAQKAVPDSALLNSQYYMVRNKGNVVAI